MDLVDKLQCHDRWLEFLEYRSSREDMRNSEREDLISFVENKEYVPCVERILAGQGLSTPVLMEVNKRGVDRKRLVFTFERDENYVLKMITYLLKEYDGLFCDDLYSFRNDTGVRKAVQRITGTIEPGAVYTYKADIHDYFNSVDPGKVLRMLADCMPDEKRLFELFRGMLNDPYAYRNGEKIRIKKGVMAGTPTAGFLANLYLADLDKYFHDKKILYARYSDDIIVFADSAEKIAEYEAYIKDCLDKAGLEINPEKEKRTVPGESFEFLGFEFSKEAIDLSDIAVKKIKAKIRRKARALYRWKIRKNADSARTAKAYIRYINNKFYHNAVKGELTWCRWYFPVITTDSRLKIIDDYAVENIRYLYTGAHGRKNYDLRYSEIRELGFKSLVNNFWKYKEGKYEMPDHG